MPLCGICDAMLVCLLCGVGHPCGNGAEGQKVTHRAMFDANGDGSVDYTEFRRKLLGTEHRTTLR